MLRNRVLNKRMCEIIKLFVFTLHKMFPYLNVKANYTVDARHELRKQILADMTMFYTAIEEHNKSQNGSANKLTDYEYVTRAPMYMAVTHTFEAMKSKLRYHQGS